MMTTIKLAYLNTKRLWRHKTLRTALAVLPLACALPHAVFVHSKPLLLVCKLCPVACVLLLGAALCAQWSMDAAIGLMPGLRSSPVSRRGIVASRLTSGAIILLAQMAVFAAILAIRR